MTITEFEELFKSTFAVQETLLPSATEIVFQFKGEEFEIESIEIKDGKIIVACAEYQEQ